MSVITNAKEHRQIVDSMTQAEINHSYEEYLRHVGESERDAAVRDTNHVLEIQTMRNP